MFRALPCVLLVSALAGCNLKGLNNLNNGGSVEYQGKRLDLWVQEFNAGSPAAATALNGALRDSKVRDAALTEIMSGLTVDGAALQDQVIAIAEGDPTLATRMRAMECLQKLGGDRERSRQVLLKQALAGTATEAVEIVLHSQAPVAQKISVASAVLDRAKPEVRRQVAGMAMAAIGRGPRTGADAASIQDFLGRLKGDKDAEVRRQIFHSLGWYNSLGERTHIEFSRSLLEDQDWTVRAQAAHEFAELDSSDRRLDAILLEAAKRKDAALCIWLLGPLRDRAEPALPALVALLASVPLKTKADYEQAYTLATRILSTAKASTEELNAVEVVVQKLKARIDSNRIGVLERTILFQRRR